MAEGHRALARREASLMAGVRPVTLPGSFSVPSALSTSAGNVAIDELVLNAINCGGSAARANWRMGTPPKTATTG